MVDDPYKVLGVSPDASPDEVKKAYRQKARENHPDLNPDDPNAAERMNDINEAYDRIMNPEKYASHDRRASSSSGGGSSSGASGSSGYNPYGQSGGGQRTNTQTNSGYGYGNPGSAGWSFVDFDDMFGYGGSGYGSREPIHPEPAAGDSPEIRSAIDAINAGRFQDAIHTLNNITSDGRNARWYYLSAIANDGAGNTVRAQEHIRRAAQMDPNNPDYQRAQRQYQQTGQTYQQQTQQHGFSPGVDAAIACLAIWCCVTTVPYCCMSGMGTPMMMTM